MARSHRVFFVIISCCVALPLVCAVAHAQPMHGKQVNKIKPKIDDSSRAVRFAPMPKYPVLESSIQVLDSLNHAAKKTLGEQKMEKKTPLFREFPK